MASLALTDVAIVLHPQDDVAIAKKEIKAGTALDDPAGGRIEARQDIRPGHKIARRARAAGETVRRYGQVIGFATEAIQVGDHVHTQNLGIGELAADRYEVGVDVRPVSPYPAAEMRYFDGYRREDGRVGTRNYVAIISGVNCSASVSQFVKDKFRDVQRDFPNIDGVLAITHKSGCGTKLFGEDHMALQRVLAGYAKHPNVAAYILVGLGCEVNQAAVMVDKQRMAVPGHPERAPFVVNIQEAGGIRKTVEIAAREVAKLLPLANEARRTPAARVGDLPRHQLRWLRLQLRHHRQPRAGLGGGRAGPLRRHRRPRRDARDLRRRAPADSPRRQRGRGQEAHRSLQVVGVVLPRHRGHGQQPRARQQGRRHHHRLREVAGRRHQGWDHAHDGRLPVRRAHQHAGLRVHGHARPRPVSITGLVGGRLQHDLLHHRAAARCSAASRCRRSSSPPTP